MSKNLPLIVVLGATACGKSKLAIQLARRFGGEIISVDSMQVYKGLDIVTNKVTKDEQSQAKHHLIDFLDPLHRYSVVDFRNSALNIIRSLMDTDSMPIIVGGTNYYIESLLWKNLILEPSIESVKAEFEKALGPEGEIPALQPDMQQTLIDQEAKIIESLPEEQKHSDDDLLDVEKFFQKKIYHDSFQSVSSEKLWRILENVDQKAAHYYHPHDKRRIIRCLQVIQDKKRKYSEILEDINVIAGSESKSLGGPLRYQRTCVLWLDCDKETLFRKLDERVDQMLDQGLLAELELFHKDYNNQRLNDGSTPNYTRGIFQTIGFKEFHDYLILDESEKQSEQGKLLLSKSIETMKISTRQYAKRQLKWIRRRFLQKGTRELPQIYKLEVSFNEETWNHQVRDNAFKIVQSFVTGETLEESVKSLEELPSEQTATYDSGKYYCEDCDVLCIGTHQIDQHLSSRSHGRRVKRPKIEIEEAKPDSSQNKM